MVRYFRGNNCHVRFFEVSNNDTNIDIRFHDIAESFVDFPHVTAKITWKDTLQPHLESGIDFVNLTPIGKNVFTWCVNAVVYDLNRVTDVVMTLWINQQEVQVELEPTEV